jgi:predicted metal-binding membrane protein
VEHTSVAPTQRTKTTVWLGLLLLAAIGWAIVLQSTQTMSRMDQGMAAMGAEPVSALIFLPLWISMMVAMMFPAVAPVVSLFATIGERRRAAGQPATPTWVFLSGYLAVWSLFGVAAYLLSLAIPALGMMAAGLRVDHPIAAGIVLILAGLYQLSPLKQVCLRHCRSPLSVILHGWRDGVSGAFRMGLGHGAYCLGCCWGLMLVLFAVGLMNLAWMIVLTVGIFGEKVLPYGPQISRVLALALIVFGALTLTQSTHPAGMQGGSHVYRQVFARSQRPTGMDGDAVDLGV